MTEPHREVIGRLSADFAAISQQLQRVSTDLVELDRLLPARQVAPPQPYVPSAAPYWPQQPVQYSPPPPPRAPRRHQ